MRLFVAVSFCALDRANLIMGMATLERYFAARRNGVLGTACMFFLLGSFAALAGGQNTGGDFFEQKIRPLLVENCYKCHSAQAEKVKGGLLLDTAEGLLKGGDSGPVIAAGDPEKSLLIKAVRYTDPELTMPPKDKKLSPDQIADLEAWVKMGAPDPRGKSASANAPQKSASEHW